MKSKAAKTLSRNGTAMIAVSPSHKRRRRRLSAGAQSSPPGSGSVCLRRVTSQRSSIASAVAMRSPQIQPHHGRSSLSVSCSARSLGGNAISALFGALLTSSM